MLVAANHPSRWTDVVVLDAALDGGSTSSPTPTSSALWPRRLLVRLYGALPVYYREEPRRLRGAKPRGVRGVRGAAHRGEAVAIFPEGASRGYYVLLPAGRRRPDSRSRTHRARRLPDVLVPAGGHPRLHITAFRADVTVTVGEPIRRAELASPGASVTEAGVRALTDRTADALRARILEIPEPRHAALFEALELIAARGAGALDLGRARALVGRIADLERADPAAYARLEGDARTFERARRALGVSAAAFDDRPPGAPARRVAALTAGMVPALVGFAVHALPAWLTRLATRRYAYDQRIAFARISAGGVLFLAPTHTIGGAALGLALGSEAALALRDLARLRARGPVPREVRSPLRASSGSVGVWIGPERTYPDAVRRARAARGRVLAFLDAAAEAPAGPGARATPIPVPRPVDSR